MPNTVPHTGPILQVAAFEPGALEAFNCSHFLAGEIKLMTETSPTFRNHMNRFSNLLWPRVLLSEDLLPASALQICKSRYSKQNMRDLVAF